MTLYGHPASGHSYKVALFLALIRVTFRYREVDIFAPRDGRGQAFQAASRFNEVPVLLVEGQALCQSNAILLWLAARFNRFGGTSRTDKTAIDEWLFWEMSRLSVGVANLRFLLRFDPDPAAELLDHYRTRSLSALDVLDLALEGSNFLVGNQPSIADLSCYGYLYWLGEAGIDIDEYPHVKRWLDDIANLPDWRSPQDLLRDASASV